MRIGIHTSIAGSLEKAVERAAALGANTMQIFSTSPRMWRGSRHGGLAIRDFRRAREKHDITPVAIHANYLINLASCDEKLRSKSVDAFREEIERALAIGAEYIVIHPGNCKGHTLEMGIYTFALALAESAKGLDTRRFKVLLENTAGSGNALGSRFEELRVIRDFAATLTDLDVGYCIDTCHCLAAGFNIAEAKGLAQTVQLIDQTLGLQNVPVIHSNDSKTPLGSRVDRHAHIGDGYIGMEGFRRILNHPRLLAKAFILETPVDKEGDDQRNVEMLKSLCRKSRMTTRK